MAPELPSAELPLDALETVARSREREGFDVTAVNTRTLLALVASARRLATAEVARDRLLRQRRSPRDETPEHRLTRFEAEIGRRTCRNDPPWGQPMSRAEYDSIHRRWYDKLPEPEPGVEVDGYIGSQCGGCRFYVPLDGGLRSDWGACANPASEHDHTAVFEHFGCSSHSDLGAPEEAPTE